MDMIWLACDLFSSTILISSSASRSAWWDRFLRWPMYPMAYLSVITNVVRAIFTKYNSYHVSFQLCPVGYLGYFSTIQRHHVKWVVAVKSSRSGPDSFMMLPISCPIWIMASIICHKYNVVRVQCYNDWQMLLSMPYYRRIIEVQGTRVPVFFVIIRLTLLTTCIEDFWQEISQGK